jgi:NTE family protein
MRARKIAIACQGGGAHAAFTWGVLKEILETKQAWDESSERRPTFDIAALSGTSAGALCALAAWYGMSPNLADPTCGTVDKAMDRLDFLWTTFGAVTPIEHVHNQFVQTCLQLKELGAPFPSLSPYHPGAGLALDSLAMLGARAPYLNFPGLLEVLCPDFASIDWRQVSRNKLRLLVGAVEVVSGNFEVFDSEKSLREMGLPSICQDTDQYDATRWRMRRALCLEGVAASGTLPEALPAQQIPDLVFPTCQPGKTVRRTGYYWDGLYSQNPPVRDFLATDDRDSKPDEIWVIRINAQEVDPEDFGTELDAIRDRMNALSGNLSLIQELDHILTVNRWLREYGDTRPPLDKFKPIDVRTIKMTCETTQRLRLPSKFDRDPTHLAELRDEGQLVTRQWLRDWQEQGRDFAAYPDDARYPATP